MKFVPTFRSFCNYHGSATFSHYKQSSTAVPTQGCQKGLFDSFSHPQFSEIVMDNNHQCFHELAPVTSEQCVGQPWVTFTWLCKNPPFFPLTIQFPLCIWPTMPLSYACWVLFQIPCLFEYVCALFTMFVVQSSAGFPDGISKSSDWCLVPLN